ncbi:MAG: polyprenyl synthetase family protein [Methylocystaceae bacterium]
MSNSIDDISYLEEQLKKQLDPGLDHISQILLQPVQGVGKLIRPRLVLMVNGLFAPPNQQSYDVAIAVECIHTASLIHDDIIDQSQLRRGLPSTMALYGAKAAVLIGDHYFATAFRLLASHSLNSILGDLAVVVSDMCIGEIKQDLGLHNPYLSEDDYFSNIYGKTASLFAGACRAGAISVGASPAEVQTLGQMGLHLGYAYQLADDVLDLTANESVLGKPTGSDLKQGIVTLPVIRALAVAPERDWLASIIASANITDLDMDQASAIITHCGAIDYTRAVIAEQQSQVSKLLLSFASSPAREQLLNLVSSLTGMSEPINYHLPQLNPELRG